MMKKQKEYGGREISSKRMKSVKVSEVVKATRYNVASGERVWETPYLKSKDEVWDYLVANKLSFSMMSTEGHAMFWTVKKADELDGRYHAGPIGSMEASIYNVLAEGAKGTSLENDWPPVSTSYEGHLMDLIMEKIGR